jgi:hypothetical protein
MVGSTMAERGGEAGPGGREADLSADPLAEAGRVRHRLARAVATLSHAALDAPAAGGEAESSIGQLLALLGVHQHPRARIRAILAELGWDAPAAVRHLQWAPIARARLEASLVGVPDALLDVRPFPGEWSVRQQLAHVELTDVRYTIATRYAVQRRDDDPVAAPAAIYPPREDSPSGNPGEPLADVLGRMRGVRAAALEPLLGIGAADLLRPTEWHGTEHTIGFRLHRFAQHDLELTTDVQRTLAAAGFRPNRAVGLASTLVEAWGELEAVLLGVPPALYVATPPVGGQSLGGYLDRLRGGDEQMVERVGAAGAS